MRQFDCPQCGASVVFQSATAEASVCTYCQSVVVRKDIDVEAVGKMAVLPPDASPLQIGAKGRLAEYGFTLLGRVRVAWAGGSWNEWFAEFSDQRRGWVAESQGFFMVLREEQIQSLDKKLNGRSKMTAGDVYQINTRQYRVVDAKKVKCLGGEGELPTPVSTDDSWQSVDLETDDGVAATLERSEEGWRLFVGKTARFSELSWQNVKEMPGWNGVPLQTERGVTQGLNCPSCGGVVTTQATGLSMSIVCTHCKNVLDTSQPQVKLLQRLTEKRVVKSTLPIGLKGTLRGTEWQIIGFMERRDPWAPWLEYLLYNPFQGYLWLTEYSGHWTLVDRLIVAPKELPHKASRPCVYHDGREYLRYSNQKCAVSYVEGEFYWQVKVGETARVADFIDPPYVVSSETYEQLNEVNWSAGESIEAKELSEAFKVPLEQFKKPTKLGMLDKNPFREKWLTFKPLLKWVLLIWVALQIFTGGSCSKNKVEHQQDFLFNRVAAPAAVGLYNTGVSTGVTTVSEPFEITRRGGVEVAITAPVNNSWLGIDLELVNQQTGERHAGDVVVSYYYGTDSDGRWTEGSTSAKATFPSILPGTYTLALDPEADALINSIIYKVQVTSGHRYFSNFILGLLLLLIYPLYLWWRQAIIEGARWADAD